MVLYITTWNLKNGIVHNNLKLENDIVHNNLKLENGIVHNNLKRASLDQQDNHHNYPHKDSLIFDKNEFIIILSTAAFQ